MILAGPRGNSINTTGARACDCRMMAELHRRIANDLAGHPGGYVCPDLLEVAELWEQAHALEVARLGGCCPDCGGQQ